MRYWPHIVACLLIVASWYWLARVVPPFLKRRGYRIAKRELYGLLFLILLVVIALLFTYVQTSGTFIWRMGR